MRKLAALLLLLSACDSDKGAQQASRAPSAAALPGEAAPVPATADDLAKFQQQIGQSLAPMLFDAGSARYANLRSGSGGAVCGEVDAKQEDGKFSGFRPFVITPEGIAVISTASRVLFNDALDIFSDFYIRWCATPEELQRLGPEIRARSEATNQLGDLPPPETAVVEPGPIPMPPPEPAPPPEPTPARPSDSRWGQATKPGNVTPPARPKDEDSFSSAVIRRREETK